MACLLLNRNEAEVQIPTTEEIETVTFYKITVKVGDVSWKVGRRYNEFYLLHNQLVADHGLSKDLLPSKKVIRNKCPLFIESRRKGLEEYLQKTFVFLKRTMPKVFVEFLHFHLYDIYFLLQDLSSKCFQETENVLLSDKTFTPLELHAISEFLFKPFPAVDSIDNKFDPSAVLELCAQLSNMTVVGSAREHLESNIIVNTLPFEMSSFKVIKTLCLKNVNVDMIYSLGNLRNTVKELRVYNTQVKSISQVLQCDVLHKDSIDGSEKWKVLEVLELSKNNLDLIDETISLAKNLTSLSLNNNKISDILNLMHLPKLSVLNLTNNLIAVCEDLHTKLGNVLILNLSQNLITTVKGFSKLYSLETLDLSCNKITQIDEIKYLCNLPCLENLILTGNGVSTHIDYRIKVLEYFGKRANCICLDNERPTQAELDKVSVMHALRIVKEGKTPNLVTDKFLGDQNC